MSNKKRLFIRSWGCQMNVYDSGRMADLLAPLGYAPAEAPDGADMVILNTCHIREKATEKLFSELGRLRKLKEEKPGMMLAVAGCVAQAEGAEITARAPFVDIVMGPQSYHKLPEMVARISRSGGVAIETEFPVEEKFDHLPAEAAPQGVSGFLTIQEGCDKFCSFCVVPYTRGAEYSRPAAAILAEARRMAAQGTREITLLGQNVNAWHGEGAEGLAGLLRLLAGIPGVERLRYTTSHPRDMDEALIAAHRDIPQVMPFLHLPVQSGSDRVLAAMNRGHTAEEYERLVDRLRAARPDLALSTDIIAGHPGEREEDHQATLRLIERIGFAQAFSFKYSSRPGTPAAAAAAHVDEATKDRRLAEVQELLRTQQADFNAGKAGTICDVLVTGPGRHAGQIAGRTPWLQPVHAFGSSTLVGRIVPVRIVAGHPNSLSGEIVEQEKDAA
ncbi:tRNA (N6-isopentenyl adenosine(37)-C2)-methylthiotransferase MiaB [Sabulicella glaciei]|uniref:tRNA-2-methylthio-N(6)-dimethylallyladenosine synthase n=1 Tax=Sabulicella glaciei TaxID=2984948 RepID=A0ABT3NY46_9PROT|nr:tRNA (N6-isopentenyl adenosine(37)-C2)-methylthiotransferase MiaB [Roseococcus sp. MDT2-1-1]MCW8087089.1 tRNA (N6-isopentenyl adenosine(37)-C2)-methylthiotransferase MiaB [Roseococcus sp. MDT2-1-1]